MPLYPLSSRDVEAIGRTRASRHLPQNIKYYLYGGFGLIIEAFLYGTFGGKLLPMMGMLVVGGVLVYYSTTLADKFRKQYIRRLKEDWQDEEEAREKESRKAATQ